MSNQSLSLSDRMRGAIWGQLVGDAASLGTHWIYDLQQLEQRYPEGVNGFETPIEGHYHFGRQAGEQTHYGDGALLLLESVAECGAFDARDFGERFVEFFASPSYRGYLDGATNGTIANKRAFEKSNPGTPFDYQQGADDAQLAMASRAAAVVVRHQLDDDVLKTVERATRVSQNNDRAVAYAQVQAQILLDLFSGEDVQSVLKRNSAEQAGASPYAKEAAKKIREVLEWNGADVSAATKEFGQSCSLTASFPSSVHPLLHSRQSFREGILATVRAGGDNAGRAAMLGAWLGAHLGVEAIPKEWREQLKAADRIAQNVEKIVSAVEANA